MEKLAALSININSSSAKIKSLVGLEYAVNLKELSFSDNSIVRLTPIKSLSLSYLNLSNNKITDSKPISMMTNPNTLYLANNKISSIIPLKNLQNLQTIDLQGKRISDISPLENNEMLLSLDLSHNLIRNINRLPSINKITRLSLAYNKLDNMNFLFNAMKDILRVEQGNIDISNNYIIDINSKIFNDNITNSKFKKLYINYYSQCNGIIVKDFANSNEKKLIKDLDINKELTVYLKMK